MGILKNKAFNFTDSKNLRSDLYLYIKEHLYDDNITIQVDDRIIVFEWYFSPQTAGTFTQQLSYQNMCITNKVDKIISEITKKK